MYLATVKKHGVTSFVIRCSVLHQDGNHYTPRDVFVLGDDPTLFIEPVGERAVFFDDRLVTVVERESGVDSSLLLENLLWDFLPHSYREMVKNLRGRTQFKLSPLSQEEKEEVRRGVHLFDRRRLYYIRYGAVDQSRIYSLNDKLYRPLLFTSRDEKERYIRGLERSLSATEMKKYLFAIFNLHLFFTESFAPFMPEALDGEKMDLAFIEAVCRLNEDPAFWEDGENPGVLREDLQMYVIRFFDSEFASRSFARDFYAKFRAKHRKFRWPEKKPTVSDEEASEIFGMDSVKLKQLSKIELLRIFRKTAKIHHPDRGGDSEVFIKLLEAYEQLKRKL